MTMDLLRGEGSVKDYGLERLIMLSDGVFAIAMTLLALEIRPPEHWDLTAVSLINSMWRELLAYGISFMVIAVNWASHRRTFSRFTRSDAGLTAINLVLLALITLLPFGSRLLAEGGPRGEPFVLYMSLITTIGVINALLWAWAAFFTTIVDRSMPFSLRLVVLLILLVLPTMMAGAGVMANDPRNWWMLVIAGGISTIALGARRWLGKRAGE